MKCGTTSMYEYLRFHPQIFFPQADEHSPDYFRRKEPHHFCPDRRLPERVSIKSRDEYLAMYAGAGDYAYRGDASASYLYSEAAPGLIKAFCPDAKILIMLRPPLEMMHSKYSALLDWLEDIPDFYEAVAASDDRRHGLRIKPGCDEDTWLDYIGPSHFAPQVAHYMETFGRDTVKVILLEDIVKKPMETWLDLLDFLGIDHNYRPDFRVHNQTRKHGRLETAIESFYRQPLVHEAVRAVIPYKLVAKGVSLIRKVDHGGHGNENPADPRETALREACRSDIARLSELLGRDLSHWL